MVLRTLLRLPRPYYFAFTWSCDKKSLNPKLGHRTLGLQSGCEGGSARELGSRVVCRVKGDDASHAPMHDI